MNMLTKTNVAITMSSREIAELTEKLHKNVLADIRKTLEALNMEPADFSARYIDSKGEPRYCFNLPRREVEILLTGYSIPLRAKVIDRLHQLEAAVAAPAAIPTNFAEALRLAAALEEKQALAATVNVMRPHAQVGAAAGQRKRLSVVEFARKLEGVNTQQVQKDLQAMQYLHKQDVRTKINP
jgi:phage regulator Rha-like protein